MYDLEGITKWFSERIQTALDKGYPVVRFGVYGYGLSSREGCTVFEPQSSSPTWCGVCAVGAAALGLPFREPLSTGESEADQAVADALDVPLEFVIGVSDGFEGEEITGEVRILNSDDWEIDLLELDPDERAEYKDHPTYQAYLEGLKVGKTLQEMVCKR